MTNFWCVTKTTQWVADCFSLSFVCYSFAAPIGLFCHSFVVPLPCKLVYSLHSFVEQLSSSFSRCHIWQYSTSYLNPPSNHHHYQLFFNNLCSAQHTKINNSKNLFVTLLWWWNVSFFPFFCTFPLYILLRMGLDTICTITIGPWIVERKSYQISNSLPFWNWYT